MNKVCGVEASTSGWKWVPGVTKERFSDVTKRKALWPARLGPAAASLAILGMAVAVAWSLVADGGKAGERAAVGKLQPIPVETAAAPVETVACPELAREESYKGKNKIFKYILPGKDGWMFRTSDFRSDFKLSDDALAAFEGIDKAMAARGSQLVVLLQPPRGLFAPAHMSPQTLPRDYDAQAARAAYRGFIESLRERDLSVVDLSDIPPESPYFMKADPHWSVAGARLTAERTAALLRDLPVYDDLKKDSFTTRIVGQEKHERGDYEVFALNTCKREKPPVSVDIWETASGTQSASADALFGDAPLPEIVALGTSNTENDRELNFIGSLKTLASADIYNAALAGGGFGGSPIAYFASDAYRKQPPRIVIWEFLAHHDFEEFTAFRQIRPAIDGPCSTAEAVATFEGDLAGLPPAFGPLPGEAESKKKKDKEKDAPLAQTVLFEKLDGKLSGPGGHYLYFELSSPVDRTVKVGILYSNGDAEEVDVTRGQRIPDNGKYFLAFDERAGAIPLLVQIGTDIGDSKIAARLCSAPGGKLARKE